MIHELMRSNAWTWCHLSRTSQVCCKLAWQSGALSSNAFGPISHVPKRKKKLKCIVRKWRLKGQRESGSGSTLGANVGKFQIPKGQEILVNWQGKWEARRMGDWVITPLISNYISIPVVFNVSWFYCSITLSVTPFPVQIPGNYFYP